MTAVDRNARAPHYPVNHSHAKDVSQAALDEVDVVVYLGGFTGRKICDANTAENVAKENTGDLVELAKRLRPRQLLVFASTSAIGEGSVGGARPFTENDTPQVDLMDSYTASMYQREVAMRGLAKESSEIPTLCALRFGTVIGLSPSQRTEFVHIAMVRAAILDGVINVRHAETHRSYVWIKDLVRAVDALIRQRDKLGANAFNLFHLVSFSSTIGRAANEVAMQTGVRTVFHEHPKAQDMKGFTLSAKKFQSRFGFEFRGTRN